MLQLAALICSRTSEAALPQTKKISTARSPRKSLARVIDLSVTALKVKERDYFSTNPSSQLGMRLVAVRVEIARLAAGLPVRVESLERALRSECLNPERRDYTEAVHA